MGPVSYTHLDVYKRQAQEIRLVQQSSDPDKRGEVRALGVLLFLLVSLFIGILLVTANVIEL